MFGAAVTLFRLHIQAAPKCGGLAAAKSFKQCLSQKMSQCKLQQCVLGIRNFANWRTLVLTKSARKGDVGWGNRFRRTMSLFRPKIIIPGEKLPSQVQTNPLNINTKIQNNVMLYRFEKPYLYKGSILFAGIALIGCLTMADNVYLVLCKDLFSTEKPLFTRLCDHFFPLACITIGLLAGPAIFAFVWFITKRTVKYIVLHKGGNTVTFVLYHPFKGESTIDVALNNISALGDRAIGKSYIPVKIRNTKKKLIVDKSGYFVNPELFDVTVGIQRFN